MKRTLWFAICLSPVLAMAQNDLAQTAQRFIGTLNEVQQKKAVYTSNSEEKYNWHFFPKTDRKGLPLAEMNEQQRNAAVDLLKYCFSEKGVQKVQDIIALEGVLKSLEGRASSDQYRDAGKYYFIVFGNPTDKTSWGWRLEGHHLSFTFTGFMMRCDFEFDCKILS